MVKATRAAMHGRFDEGDRLAADARDLGLSLGHEAAQRIWVTNREARLRAADRHDEMLKWDLEARRARAMIHIAAAWQSMGSALTYARLERVADARMHVDLLPEEFRSTSNLFAMSFVGEAAAFTGPRELALEMYERIKPLRDGYVMLGMSYLGWEGPWARILALLAAHLERWDDARGYFEDALARCRRLNARPYLARTEYEYGRMLMGRGDGARARELIGSARRAAEELGMTGLIGLADAKLAGLGAGPAGTQRPPAPAPGAPAAREPFSFTAEGEYWAVTHAGQTFRLKDSLGIQYLVRLFEQPGREIHVLDLAGERAAAGGANVNEAIDTGDAGELLDEEARRSYQRRLEDLEDAVAEAESFGDTERVARAREEIEMLGAELGRAVGLGGRARRAGGAAERARSAVQRRIKNAIDRIGEHSPALATLLSKTVRTGNYCVYRPEP